MAGEDWEVFAVASKEREKVGIVLILPLPLRELVL